MTIVVSKGRQPIEVTDYTGKPADQAVAALTDAGLRVDATKQDFDSDTCPRGSVISQSPARARCFRGDQVTLVVSKGPEMVSVPNVQGKQLAGAHEQLEAAGFDVKVETVHGRTVRHRAEPEPGRRQHAARADPTAATRHARRRLSAAPLRVPLTPAARSLPASRLATLLLVALTAVWGSTFFLIRDLVEHVPPADFLAVRFAIAAVVMLLVFWRRYAALTRRQVLVGVGARRPLRPGPDLPDRGPATHTGLRLGLRHRHLRRAHPGLHRRAAARPRGRVHLGWPSGSRPSAWPCCPSTGSSVGFGEAITLLAAALYALHIVGLGRYSASEIATGLSRRADVRHRRALLRRGPPRRHHPAEQTRGQWALGALHGALRQHLALWAQTWAQSHLPATRAAIVMTLEPVFAAFFAVTARRRAADAAHARSAAPSCSPRCMSSSSSGGGPDARRGGPPAELLHHEV